METGISSSCVRLLGPSVTLSFSNQLLFRDGGGMVQIGRGSMIFMQGKWGAHTFMRTIIGELFYTKGVRGERVSKKCAAQRGNSPPSSK